LVKTAAKSGETRMIATQNQQPSQDHSSRSSVFDIHLPTSEQDITSPAKFNPQSSQLLSGQPIAHATNAGLNPLVDAAGYLFSVLGKLKQLSNYRHLPKLQKELMQEISSFQETLQRHGYNTEYAVVCRYTLCATFDDIIANTLWGAQGQWENFSLLAAFNQDSQHQNKFFTILERAIKDPAQYIDLMEFMYICLSMGYKGQYRATEHSHFQLEQITNNLYKHIRAYRGSFSKMLSPAPMKPAKLAKKITTRNKTFPLFIFFVTGCLIMTIFVSLGYFMDVVSNEAYQHVAQIQTPTAVEVA
jgi:type VI secretion system protein ImpK